MRGDVIFVSLALFLPSLQSQPLSINLGGGSWKVSNTNGSISVATIVPGMIHTDLLAAGVISEPYYGYNDVLQGWIAEEEFWTYDTSFPTPLQSLGAALTELSFDGLATVANVSLNGVLVLSTNNQFRSWRASVGSLLRRDGVNNSLVVKIASSVRYAASADAAYNMSTHNITSCPNPSEHGYCYRQFVRQNPSSFSWDWAPAFASVGIYKTVALIVYGGSAPPLRGVTTIVSTAGSRSSPLQPGGGGAWTVNFTLWLEPAPQAVQSGIISITLPGLNVNASTAVSLRQGGLQAVSILVNVPSAEAWWPASFARAGGYPMLYNASVTYVSDVDGSSVGKDLRVGFRTVALVADEPLPGGGFSFYFRVNGIKTYLKGSNLVPLDAFESRVTSANLTAHFDAFEWAGFNILRHWGGALYQRDEFFDLADERGVLIFMEFSFANANYPIDQPFLENVAAEVHDQALRLQSHPSILLWSANNEIARGLARQHVSNPSSPTFPLYVRDYVTFFFDTVLTALSEVDQVSLFGVGSGARPSLSTTPSQGNNTADWPIPFEPPNASGTTNLSGFFDGLWQGDFHGYLYDIDCWNASEYPRTRFSTEFGLQSWPSLQTMSFYSAVTPAQASNYSDPFWAWRNHHPGGQGQIEAFILQHFPAPAQSDVRGWLWMSQVTQSYCIRQQAEHYRRIVSECEDTPTGGGCNAGALYWQGVDVWPAPSWSSIEYGGRLKLLHYAAARFFAPFLVSAFLDGDMTGGGLYVINEDNTTVSGNVTLSVVSFAEGLVATLPPLPFSVGPAASSAVARFTIADLLSHAGGACPSREACFLVYDAHSPTPPPKAINATPSGPPFLLLGSVPSSGGLVDPGLVILGVQAAAAAADPRGGGGEGAFLVSWNASAPAIFVWFETSLRGRWSDNGFTFVPTVAPGVAPLTWTAAPDGAVPSASELLESLRVWSLYDIAAGRDLTARWPVDA